MSKTSFDSRTGTILAVLVMAELVGAAEAAMIYGAMSKLMETFHDPVILGWMLTAFLLIQAVAAALCGRAGDMFGRKRVLLIVLSAACGGSVISAFWPTAEGVTVGRAIQGLAGAVLPLCHGLVREHFPKDRIEFGIGVIAASAVVLGGALGGLGGALVAQHLGWKAIFHFTAAAALVAIVLVAWLLPPSSAIVSNRRIDFIGGIAFAPATAGILFAVTKSKEWGWGDSRIVITAVCSVAMLLWWLKHERSQEEPLIDVRLLADRRIALANLGLVLFAVGSMNSLQVLFMFLPQPTWTGTGFGTAPSTAGWLVAPAMLLAFVAGPIAGKMARARGTGYPLFVGACLLALAWAVLAVHHTNLSVIFAMLCVHSFGTVMCYAAIPMILVEAAPAERTSEANGLSVVMRATAHSIGAQIMALLLASSTVRNPTGGASYPTDAAYTLGFGFIALTAAGCIVVALVLWHGSSRSATLGEARAKTMRRA